MSEETRKAGRPRTSPDGERRNAKVVVYVTPSEQQTVRLAAETSGKGYSAYVRDALLNAGAASILPD